MSKKTLYYVNSIWVNVQELLYASHMILLDYLGDYELAWWDVECISPNDFISRIKSQINEINNNDK